ncbi:MAG: hypothetical protein N2045_12410 [Fimbriimonadales bacterium]|jgi:RNase H-fold protein (predicted Holliday junction resolvase)|nr:hypothetical protein [Fimbriimonadales bacterium]GIV13021.1 MAG: hypothetical protein KatS3mg021_1303 [Fimbriimonadales bacterium]CUU08298.1 RNase H-fold protein, predicted Holliday junction resolvase [Armatimonadetes bacterium GBS]CUU38831.1 RNase H-fold protein, predicted Holliday junction resolvase [Armatimonadetes bacterium GXS]
MRVLAIDPGNQKAGVVVVDLTPGGYQIQYRAILPIEELTERLAGLLQAYQPVRVLVGKGTGSRRLMAALRERFPNLAWEAVEERNTTLQARELYFRHHPPRGWRRWLPKGLRVPPEPYDDYAALAIALQACNPQSR